MTCLNARLRFLSASIHHLLKLGVGALGLGLIACATVNPVPVSPNDRTTPGMRFYEMRPFVLVQKPFPFWAKTVFVDARVSEDGRNAKILSSLPTDFVRAFLVPDSSDNLATKSITVTPLQKTPTGQAGETQVPPPSGQTGAPPAAAPGGNAPQPAPPTNKAGSGSIAYQMDKDGTPMVPINDLFSIVFLPDYSREYAIDLKTHFGFAKINLKVGPGGGLLAYNADVDNSQLVAPLIQLYTNLVNAGGAVAAAAINPHAAAAKNLAPSAQAGETVVPGTAAKLPPASIVTLRLTLVRYAIPGPHPILKPGEHPSKIDASGTVTTDTASNPGLYEVDYRYFEVPVAEALLDSPSALTVVSTPTPPPGGGGHPTNKCADKKMLSKSNASPLGMGKILSQIKADLKVTSATPVNVDSDNCVGEIDVNATVGTGDGATPFTDSDNSVKGQFEQNGYSGTKLVFK